MKKSFFTLISFCVMAVTASAAPRAEQLMTAAQKQAASEGKQIFLVFSTKGCGWCKVLKSFIESDEIKPIFSKYFVPAYLMLGDDAESNPGADVYGGKYQIDGGVPFHLFLTAEGKVIVDSRENGS